MITQEVSFYLIFLCFTVKLKCNMAMITCPSSFADLPHDPFQLSLVKPLPFSFTPPICNLRALIMTSLLCSHPDMCRSCCFLHVSKSTQFYKIVLSLGPLLSLISDAVMSPVLVFLVSNVLLTWPNILQHQWHRSDARQKN